jgi:hypothetical protein
MENNTQEIRDLCTRIIAEKDPDKLTELTKQLDVVLEARGEKLRHIASQGNVVRP